MPIALVGSAGAVSQGASGAAITPAYGQPPTAWNLLVCPLIVQGATTNPAIPSGWSNAGFLAGTSCGAKFLYRIATGGDAAPTIALVTGAVLTAQLMEFSGITITSPLDHDMVAAGTSSPFSASGALPDVAAGELIVYCAGALYSVAATSTLAVTLNNGATATDTANSGATSTVDHYEFGYGVTTSNAVHDMTTFTLTTTNETGAIINAASFKQFSPLNAPLRGMPLGC